MIICDRCKKSANSLNSLTDCHGNQFALVCGNCYRKLRVKLEKFMTKYGWIDGICSPRGTPFIRNEKDLDAELIDVS